MDGQRSCDITRDEQNFIALNTFYVGTTFAAIKLEISSKNRQNLYNPHSAWLIDRPSSLCRSVGIFQACVRLSNRNPT